MFSDQLNEHLGEDASPPNSQTLPLLQFPVQLQNIFPAGIVANRFPLDKAVDMASVVTTAHTQLNLGELAIDQEALQAQISLELHVSFSQEPRLFEIYFKMIGIFSYVQEYPLEMVQQFLQQGSLGVMLPSARELLLSLCTRLQVPMIVLPLVQLIPPPFSPENKLENNSNE
ncbi:MAG: hypothetical protein ABI396_05160 [Ktedonobacteraceae bacterium]